MRIITPSDANRIDPKRVRMTIIAAKLARSGDEKAMDLFRTLNDAEQRLADLRTQLTEAGDLTKKGIDKRVAEEREKLVEPVIARAEKLLADRRAHWNTVIEQNTPERHEPLSSDRMAQIGRAWSDMTGRERKAILAELHKPENRDFAKYIADEHPRLSGVAHHTAERALYICTGQYDSWLQDVRDAAVARREGRTPAPSENPVVQAHENLKELDGIEHLFVAKAQDVMRSAPDPEQPAPTTDPAPAPEGNAA